MNVIELDVEHVELKPLSQLGGDEKVCVWPCGTWCLFEELNQMTHKSDDYATVRIMDDEDAEQAAERHMNNEANYWTTL